MQQSDEAHMVPYCQTELWSNAYLRSDLIENNRFLPEDLDPKGACKEISRGHQVVLVKKKTIQMTEWVYITLTDMVLGMFELVWHACILFLTE